MTDNLSGVMRSATEDLHPNISKLTSGGIERGVRKRRNRRITQIAGATASVAAVFAVVATVAAPGQGGSGNVSAASGTSGNGGNAADSGGKAAAPPAHSPSNATTEAEPGPNKPKAPPVSGDDMAKWLEQALAPYHFTGEQVLYKAGTGEPSGPYATLRIGYDGQAGSTSLAVERATWQSGGGTLPPYNSTTQLPDGSHLDVFNGPEWPAGNGDPSAKRIQVTWYRTDGTAIDLQILNAVQEKGSTTATSLGLTVAQATKVVQSPVWAKAVASVLAQQEPNKPGSTSSPAVPPAR